MDERMRVDRGLCYLRIVAGRLPLLSLGLALAACKIYHDELLRGSFGGHVDDAGSVSTRSDASASAARSATAQTEQREAVACAEDACFWSVERDGCQSVGFPGVEHRPAPSEATETLDHEIYLGLRSLRLSSPSAGTDPVGLDVDATCTESPTCTAGRGVASCVAPSAELERDGPGCRDNAFAAFMTLVSQHADLTLAFGLSEESLNCELWRGGHNVLTRISGYNGASEDSLVRVDWYTSNGIEQLPSWRCPAPDFREKHAAWSSDAAWSIDAAELTSAVSERGRLPSSRISDPRAFVRNGYLVSQLPDGALLRFAGDGDPWRGIALPARASIWMGRLSRTADGLWSLSDGLFAGRIASDELLRSVRQAGICEQGSASAHYARLAQYVARHSDVLASGEADSVRVCDAMSFGIGFDAVPVSPGEPVRPLPALVECCEPGVPPEQCQPRCGDGLVSGAEHCDTALSPEQQGACPQACPPRHPCELRNLVGSGCGAHCEASAIATPRSGDGCCPDGASSRSDTDCKPSCGNGLVELGETCDPPSACPSCASDDRCLTVTTTGAADSCNVVCAVSVIEECRSEDGCCPAHCSYGGDNDCSPRCGDGRVEPGTTETCETRGPNPCMPGCDDGDSCTRDLETGSSTNCNLRCSHFPITEPAWNDGCCPTGASQQEDSDC